MKVFVLECGWPYEGGDVMGVFKERKDAENEAAVQMKSDRRFEWYDIKEFEVK